MGAPAGGKEKVHEPGTRAVHVVRPAEDAPFSVEEDATVAVDCKSDVSLVDKIFHQLTDDEKEHAARSSSYRYFVASSSPEGEAVLEQRDTHARAMINRYVTVEEKLHGGKKSLEEKEVAALTKLRATLAYRAEKQVDDIRVCFDPDKRADADGLHATIRERLEKRYANKASNVRGYTKDGRAMFLNFPRVETSWNDEEYYIKGNIYNMERALACTERNGDGRERKIVVFYDYGGYTLKNSPPPLLVKQLLSDLRDHWPERVQHTFVVDTPFIFRAFWAIIKHFIDPITKDLVQFVTGEEQKAIFREMIGEDQAAPFMFEDGKDGEEADMKSYFYDVPFDQVYGKAHN